MTVQIVEIAGQQMAVLPAADYERLLDAAEDRWDSQAAAAANARRDAGEAYLPAAQFDRILAGESALKVWREFRGLTQAALGNLAGCGAMAVSSRELGKTVGALTIWRALAEALGVTTDDILPA